MEFKLELDQTKLNKPIMFLGLPGIGLVGKIAMEYLTKNTTSKKIGSLYGSIFPPMVFVNKDGFVELMKDEIFALKGKENDFLIITGDVQPAIGNPLSDEQHYYFAKKILEIAKKMNVEKIYTFAGIDIGDERITTKPKIQFATTNKEELEYLTKLKLKRTKDELTISGIAGLLVGLAKEENITASCILGETSGKLVYGDHESSKIILEFVSKAYGLDINLKDIKKDAKKITKAFQQVVSELKKISKAEGKDTDKLTYIR